MQSDFWLERWRTGQLGWHREDVNPALVRHWPSVGLDPASKVLVPLCGKTRDMAWLAHAGHEVLGCELSAIAAREFFTDSNLGPHSRRESRFVRHRGGSVTILEGDVFDLDQATLAGIEGVYDRGALVALPPDMRRRYAAMLARLLPPGVRTLLLTLEYDQSRIAGPPFSVPEVEVHELYDGHEIGKLFTEDTTEAPPRFAAAGLGGPDSPVRQKVWRIVPRTDRHGTPVRSRTQSTIP